MSNVVEFTKHDLPNGYCLGRARLNAPKSLNALSLDMIQALAAQLRAWQEDDSIVAVWLDAAGDKAFCAGGDIVQLYHSMLEANSNKQNAYAESFFAQEYSLDYLIHTYSKPILCWGNGIVMGGGVGLLSACSHRVVTETSRIAMPEISIGLFPDVGGSWFLSRMPGQSGLFLGLTGASMNAADALYVGYADSFVKADLRDAVFAALTSCADWTGTLDADSALLDRLLQAYASQSQDGCPVSAVKNHQKLINELCDASSIVDVCKNIMALQSEDKWLSRASKTLQKGCPVTMQIIPRQLHRAQGLSLAEVFRMEFNLAIHCVLNPDFREGIRALLIDKDGLPQWSYQQVQDVPDDYAEAHFSDIHTVHPLAVLN